MSKNLKKYSISDLLNYDWLKEHNVCLSVEDMRYPYRAFYAARFIKKQVANLSKAETIKTLSEIFFELNDRTFYRWFDGGWKIEKIYHSLYKTYINNLPKSGKDQFTIKIYSIEKKPKLLGGCVTCLDEMENVVLRNVEKTPLIDISKVMQVRENEFAKTEDYVIDLTTREKIEQVVKDICHYFASGLVTIVEACERHKLTYIQFIELLTQDELYYQMYQTGCRLANQFHSSRQLSQVDNLIYQLLSRGNAITEQITYEKVMIPGQLEPKWIEKRKTVTKRELGMNEIMLLKIMLLKTIDISQLTNNTDEFSNMDEAELLNFVLEKQDEIKGLARGNLAKD